MQPMQPKSMQAGMLYTIKIRMKDPLTDSSIYVHNKVNSYSWGDGLFFCTADCGESYAVYSLANVLYIYIEQDKPGF